MATTPINTVQGIASGIQWQDMIDQIIQVESAPITTLNNKITALQARESAWNTFESDIQAFSDAASGLADGSSLDSLATSISGLASGAVAPFSVSAGSSAVPADYQVNVSRIASAEKLGGASFGSTGDALGFTGEFLVNGTHIAVGPSDSLTSIAARLNAAGAGVSAGVVGTTTGGYRLTLTSTTTGAGGISLRDGSNGVLRSLGLLSSDATTAANTVSNGVQSAAFSDSTTAVDTLLGLTDPPTAASVTFGDPASGGFTGTLDLTQTLAQLASSITTQAATAGSAITASVVTDSAGAERLQINGTTSFQDPDHALELLGVVQGGRGSTTQSLTTGALTDTGAGQALGTTTFAQMGSVAGESVTVSGTLGDGTAVDYTFQIATGTETLADFVDGLNTALQSSGRTATATLDTTGGTTHLVVTDGTSGDSLLSLDVVANNEHGGTLNFGALDTTAGQTREITAGADALMTVDGTPIQSSTNTVTGAVPGLTFNLSSTTSSTLGVTVASNTTASATAIKTFVTAYNKLVDFVTTQNTPPASGQDAPPLFGDTIMRGMRNALNDTMQRTLASGVAGSLIRLTDIGIEIDKTGHYTVDDTKLAAALASDPGAVTRLFGLSGSADTGSLSYVGAGDETKDGTYAIQITQAATTASQTGATAATGAGTVTVTDIGSGKSYSVSVTDGESAADVAAALNNAFATAKAQVLQGDAITDQAGSAAATDATTWADAVDGTSTRIAANGDVLTVSGTAADGSAFNFDYTVSDTATLGDLRSKIQQELGTDATVSWDASGHLTVTAADTGSSLLSLAVTSTGTNGAPFGVVSTTTEGRPAANLEAGVYGGGALTLDALDYGSASGFTVAYSGTDLGIAAGSYTGQDVAGTIGGFAATGAGQTLTGATGTDVDGLAVNVSATGAGSAGSISFSRGIGSAALLAAEPILGTDSGSISSITTGIDNSITDDNTRIDDLQARLDQRRTQLTQEFIAMEQAIAAAQTQSSWLASQIAALPTIGGTTSSGSSSGG